MGEWQLGLQVLVDASALYIPSWTVVQHDVAILDGWHVSRQESTNCIVAAPIRRGVGLIGQVGSPRDAPFGRTTRGFSAGFAEERGSPRFWRDFTPFC